MHNGLDANLTIGVSAEAISKLNKPMSHNARKLMSRMIPWVTTKYAKDFSNSKAKIIEAFAAVYNPITYESMVQAYDVGTFPGNGRSNAAMAAIESVKSYITPREQALALLKLDFIASNTWAREANLISNIYRVGNIENQDTIEIYKWITNKFIVTDFNEQDLNKICEMGAVRMSLSIIKEHAAAITDHTKKTIPYLFAVARDSAIRDAVARDAIQQEEKIQRQALAKVMQYSSVPADKFSLDKDTEDSISRADQYMSVLDSIK